jgi:2-polyprenyl-3-methyl-5-hydroxy-6-metoxy-1,4-benzoquinol methylase
VTLDSIDEVRAFYLKAYKIYGSTARGMHWTDEDTHYLRLLMAQNFVMATSIPRTRILDVGCGVGMLPAVWKVLSGEMVYHGIDVVQEYIDEARSRYNWSSNYVFVNESLDDFVCLEPYYVTAAIGVFAWQPADVVREMIRKLWRYTAANGAMVFTYLDGNPLHKAEMRMVVKNLPDVSETIEYSGYAVSGESMIVLTKKPWMTENKHLEELEDEVTRGEHREDEGWQIENPS